MNSNNIIAIIPARGSSKEIPNKNIIDFCGKPLLSWSILHALKSNFVDDVYVSSDDENILDVAADFGAKKIKRPPGISTDTATSESAILHAIKQIESTSAAIDLIVFLQATSPLRTSEDIDTALKSFHESGSDSLFSMSELDDICIWQNRNHELKGMTYDPFNRGRRQDRKPYYLENGSIYIFKPEIIKKCNNRLGGKISMYKMPFWKSYEIDKIEDIEICEYFFKRYLT